MVESGELATKIYILNHIPQEWKLSQATFLPRKPAAPCLLKRPIKFQGPDSKFPKFPQIVY